jgi:hypothetical protein
MTRLLGTWRVAVLWLAVMGSLLLAGSASGATSVHAASFYEYDSPAASTTITAQHRSVVLISRASPRTVPRSSTTSLAPSLATKGGRSGRWMSPQEWASAEAREIRNKFRDIPTETGRHGSGLRAGARELRERADNENLLPEIREALRTKADQWDAKARGIDHPGRR